MNDGDRFDDLARAVHAHSLDALSVRTRAQLQLRRRAALAMPAGRRPRALAWPLAATACAVVAALAVGWQLRAPGPGPAATPATMPVATLPDDDSTTLALEENPELYAWLASSDAATLAME